MKSRRVSATLGFSLIELLVASTLVAAVGVLLISALVAANRSTDARIDQTLAAQALASQLALLDDQFTATTATTGPCAASFANCAWTLGWTNAPLAPLAEATLTVTHHGHTTHAHTYRLLAQP